MTLVIETGVIQMMTGIYAEDSGEEMEGQDITTRTSSNPLSSDVLGNSTKRKSLSDSC
jgi:CobQ-like glutamine amidotransferase family enzyme